MHPGFIILLVSSILIVIGIILVALTTLQTWGVWMLIFGGLFFVACLIWLAWDPIANYGNYEDIAPFPGLVQKTNTSPWSSEDTEPEIVAWLCADQA